MSLSQAVIYLSDRNERGQGIAKLNVFKVWGSQDVLHPAGISSEDQGVEVLD